MRSLAFIILATFGLVPVVRAEEKPVAIGAKVGNLAFKDTHFLNRSLDDFKNRRAFVLVFVDTGCPIVQRYLPVLKRLEAEYRKQDVQFLAVNVGCNDTIVDLAALAIEYEAPFPFLKDTQGKCLDALGVERTPEVVVLDAQRKIRYRGRIDDQYRPGGNLPAPTRQDLKEALDELLAGKEVSKSSTIVDGCKITRPAATKAEKPVTYAEHVGPLLLKNCAGCHRPNEATPFSLLTYEQAKARAATIAEVTTDGKMPPWYAASGHGKFSNERRLSAAERDLIRQWVRGGMPKGEDAAIARLPNVEKRQGDWRTGNPDRVLATTTFDLPAEGDIDYKYTVLPGLFLDETWAREVEIIADNPRVVHHANLFYVSAGKKLDAANFITGLVPGAQPMTLPDGVAVRLPAASVLALQIHFVATGKPEKCKLRVGLKYASGGVKQQLRFHLFDGGAFSIPAGEPALQLKRSFTLDCNAVGIGMFTHMHLRGKAMTFGAEPPNGQAETLLVIPNYDFNWQVQYVFEPGAKKFPKGSKIRCTALYDNSDCNPFNPDPKAIVRPGPQTYNEMMNGFFFYVNADENLGLDVDPKSGLAKKKSEDR
jgi:mono/diheme cytochrome c family protein